MSDLLMWVGKKPYPWPNDFSDEAFRDGVSKRVNREAIPEIEPGVTQLALIHPKAIVKVAAEGMEMRDLARELLTEHAWISFDQSVAGGFLTALEAEIDALLFENQSMSGLTDLLREAEKAKDLERLEEKYGIEYHAGVFGFCFLSAVHYLLKDDEGELPEDLEDVAGIKAVRMDYSEEVNDD